MTSGREHNMAETEDLVPRWNEKTSNADDKYNKIN